MASVLALLRLPRHNGVCRLACRGPAEGTRSSLVHGSRQQSTQTNTQFNQTLQKRRAKTKPTVDVIQVQEQNVSEAQAKVTRITRHSIDHTIRPISSLAAHTPPPADHANHAAPLAPRLHGMPCSIAANDDTISANVKHENILGFNEESTLCPNLKENSVISELLDEATMKKFNELFNWHLEEPLRSSDGGDAVRWHNGVTHTYDASFMVNGDAFESNVDIERLSEKSRKEVEEMLQLSETDLSSLLNPLSGFAHVADEQVTKVKKKSNKKQDKIISSEVISKVSSANALKSKGRKASRKAKVKSEHEVEEEELFVARDTCIGINSDGVAAPVDLEICPEEEVPEFVIEKENKKKKTKKSKMEDDMKKYMESVRLKGKEISFNQSLEAYLSVCINVGMLNRALHTLLFYRRLSKYTKGTKVSSIGPYLVLLQAFADRGNYAKIDELMQCLREDDITPDKAVYGALLSCLGRQQPASINTDTIKDTLENMEKDGVSLVDVFRDVNFVRDSEECAVSAVRRVQPHFTPQDHDLNLGYDCILVNSLNQDMHSNQIESPAKDLANRDMMDKWIKEQLAMELKCEITIDSIQKKAESENVQFYRDKLACWEKRWREALSRAFVDQVDGLKHTFFGSRRDKRMSLYPYLVTLPAEDFVNIMLQEVNRVAGGSEAYSPSRYQLYRRLGELVHGRYLVHRKKETGHLDKLQKVYRDYCDWYMAPKGRNSYIPRVRFSELAAQHESGLKLDHCPLEWPNTVMLAIGQFLYNILLTKVMIWRPFHSEKHAYPALYEVERSYGYRVIEEIKPSPTLLDLFRKASKPTLTFDAFVAPMVSPPLPWISTKLGGYLLTDTKIVRLPYNAHQQTQRMEEGRAHQLYPVMDSLNQLSATPWRVNTPMLDLLIQIFNDKGWDEMDVAPPPSEHPPPTKVQPGMDPTEVAQLRRQRIDYYKKKNEMHSLWCDALYKLSLANHFRDRVFWFPHNMDFRGRVYPCPPHLNHLSSDVFRSILKFARGEKLGPNGLRWLKLHLINLTGIVKKKSVDERIVYCEEMLPEILDSADNPLTGRRWWTNSDEPWQTLAACKELAAALRSPDPSEFVSHLPIHQDGSCNGLQHYAALGRDQAGAVSVNLAPSLVPQDVYSAVAALVEKERQKDAAGGKDIARTLDGYVRRKVIKQTVMTTVYGVTRYGARLQIEKQLKALDDFPPEQRWAASQYLVQKTFQSLEQMFTATKEIQDWFTECARLIAQVRSENIEWVTPLGFPVVQPYSKLMNNKISPEKLPTSFTMDSFMKPNVMKQKNAFPPNFIHSLDSSHMMLTSLFCQHAGITFVSVHDCFWTHASTVNVMNEVCRKQFVALHNEPILEDLSFFLLDKFGYKLSDFKHDGTAADSSKMKLNNLLGRVPRKGNFDISNVLRSTFFFS